MSTLCLCNKTTDNTGQPTKHSIIKNGVFLYLWQLKADDGTVNGIDVGDALDQAYLDDLINHIDPSKRIYPVGNFDSVADVRGDAITESYTDGSTGITQQGVRAYQGWLMDYSAAYINNLKAWGCNKFGFLAIDSCGDIIGTISKDGQTLLPTQVNEKSWNPTVIFGNDTERGKIQLAFEYSQLEKDRNLRVISEDETAANWIGATGLINLSGAISGITATTATVAVTVDYDAFITPEKVIGWILADFLLFNTTTNLAVAITLVTEAPEGTYELTYVAQTAADVMRLTDDRTTAAAMGFYLEETYVAV